MSLNIFGKQDTKKFIALIVVLALVILIIPGLLRFWNHNPYISVSESYFHSRLFNNVGLNFYDALQQRSLGLNIFYLIPLTGFMKIMILIFLPLLLGALTVVFSYLLLKKHNIASKYAQVIMLLLIVSPIFIYTFSNFNFYGIIVFMSVLGLYLMTRNHKVWATIIFCLMPLIDFYGALITFVFLILYFWLDKDMFTAHKNTLSLFFVFIVLSLIVDIALGHIPFSSAEWGVNPIITEIGANIGFSFAIMILWIIGFVLLLEKGLKNFLVYSVILLLIMLSLFNTYLRIYLNFVIIIYAGFAFIYLTERKWSISIIKKTTLMLIICSILFSTLSYTTKLVRAEPTPELVDGLIFLEKQGIPNEKVLSTPANSYFIQYYSDLPTFIDENHDKYIDMLYTNISSSRNLEKTDKMFRDNNIHYLFIDKEFKKYLEEKQGLLFLMDTSHKFVKIYSNNKVEIWMYAP